MIGKPRSLHPLSKLIPEARRAQRAPVRLNDEGERVARGKIEGGLKLADNGDGDGRAGLALLNRDRAVADMPPAEADEIAAPLRGAQREFEHQPFPRARQMESAIVGDLVLGPRGEAAALVLQLFDADAGIIVTQAERDGLFHQNRDHAEQAIRRIGRGGFFRHEVADVLRPHADGALVAVRLAKPLQDISIDAGGACPRPLNSALW